MQQSMKVEMADGKYMIEQIPEGDMFKITIYENGHKVISMSDKTAESYGGLSNGRNKSRNVPRLRPNANSTS